MKNPKTLRDLRARFETLREQNTGDDPALRKELVTMLHDIRRAEGNLDRIDPYLRRALEQYDLPDDGTPCSPEDANESNEGSAREVENARIRETVFRLVRYHLEMGDVGVTAHIRSNEMLTRLRGELLWLSDAIRGFIPECTTPKPVLKALLDQKQSAFALLLDAEIWDMPADLIRPEEIKMGDLR